MPSCPRCTFVNPRPLTEGVFFQQAAAGTGCSLRVRDHARINPRLFVSPPMSRDSTGTPVTLTKSCFLFFIFKLLSSILQHLTCLLAFLSAKPSHNLIWYCNQTVSRHTKTPLPHRRPQKSSLTPPPGLHQLDLPQSTSLLLRKQVACWVKHRRPG